MKKPRQFPLSLVFASGVALTFGLTMAVFYRLMRPPVQDIALLTRSATTH